MGSVSLRRNQVASLFSFYHVRTRQEAGIVPVRKTGLSAEPDQAGTSLRM